MATKTGVPKISLSPFPWVLWMATLLLCGCGTLFGRPSPQSLVAEAKTQGISLTEPLWLGPSSRAAIRERVGLHGTQLDRMRRLVRYLTHGSQLNFQYDVNLSLGAEEAFLRRRGDYASYSNLLVVAARDLGVSAHFAYVREAPVVLQHVGPSFVSSHLAVLAGEGTDVRVFDLGADEADWKLVAYQSISDGEARAVYFNNVAGEWTASGHLEEAERFLSLVVAREPKVRETYSNLGAVRLREDRVQEALEGMEKGLELYPNYQPLLTNAVAAARRLADVEKEKSLESAAEVRGKKDPFVQFERGLEAFFNGSFNQAAQFFQQAIKLLPENPAPWACLARAQISAGEEASAKEALAQLKRLNPNHPLLRDAK